jgi:site-specific DNA-methyltransferase (adenine-specific)/modification methylase
MSKALIIDKEFKSLIPPLTPEEFNQLEQNCLNDGILESIKVWNDVIIDGHNRHEIASKNGLDFAVTELNFENRTDAIEWIILHQLGRRNLTEEQKAYLRGKRYENEKLKITNKSGSNQFKKELEGQNVPQPTTSEKLAEEYGVSDKTIKRDADFAKGVDLLPEERKTEVLSGKSELKKQEVQQIGKIRQQVEKQVKADAVMRTDEDIQAEIEVKAKELAAIKLKEIELAKKNKYAQVAERIKNEEIAPQSKLNEADAAELNLKTGDIVTVSKNKIHKIFIGTCSDFLNELKKCDCVVTDPPYGIAYKSPTGSAMTQRGDYKVIENDDKDYDPSILFEISDKVITWGGNHYANKLPNSAGWLVWDKRDGEQINNNSDCELAWTNMINSARMFHHRWNGMIKASEHGQRRIHPTQKPVALFEWALDICSAGNVVADPYLGSGSCLIACDKTNRTCIASEIDIDFAAATIKRLIAEGFKVSINE